MISVRSCRSGQRSGAPAGAPRLQDVQGALPAGRAAGVLQEGRHDARRIAQEAEVLGLVEREPAGRGARVVGCTLTLCLTINLSAACRRASRARAPPRPAPGNKGGSARGWSQALGLAPRCRHASCRGLHAASSAQPAHLHPERLGRHALAHALTHAAIESELGRRTASSPCMHAVSEAAQAWAAAGAPPLHARPELREGRLCVRRIVHHDARGRPAAVRVLQRLRPPTRALGPGAGRGLWRPWSLAQILAGANAA